MPDPGRASPGPAPSGVVWTADRTELCTLLTERHPDLGGLYELAINTVAGGVTLPRLLVTAHCIRELCSEIPILLGDAPEPRADINRAARELADAWAASDLDPAVDVEQPDDDALHAVPRRVFRAAGMVAAAGAEGTRKSRVRTALLATGRATDAGSPLIARLHKAIEFFRGWGHQRDYSVRHRTLPSVEKIEEELRIIEDALLTRLGNMADRARALRDLIAHANRRSTGEA